MSSTQQPATQAEMEKAPDSAGLPAKPATVVDPTQPTSFPTTFQPTTNKESKKRAATEDGDIDAQEPAQKIHKSESAGQENSVDKEESEDQGGTSDLKEGQYEDEQAYTWCRIKCDPNETWAQGMEHYWWNSATQETSLLEPKLPWWIWNQKTQGPDQEAGLQQPTPNNRRIWVERDGQIIMRYIPAIHGSYDANAPYAKYQNVKAQAQATAGPSGEAPANVDHYAAMATFNSRTGAFQAGDISSAQHTDEAKAGRQLSAFFDVAKAANAHNGESLKAKRREQKATKAVIQRSKEKRREKKLAWLKD